MSVFFSGKTESQGTVTYRELISYDGVPATSFGLPRQLKFHPIKPVSLEITLCDHDCPLQKLLRLEATAYGASFFLRSANDVPPTVVLRAKSPDIMRAFLQSRELKPYLPLADMLAMIPEALERPETLAGRAAVSSTTPHTLGA